MFTFAWPLSSLETAAHIEATIEQSVIASCAKSMGSSCFILISSDISVARLHESKTLAWASDRGSIPMASLEGQ